MVAHKSAKCRLPPVPAETARNGTEPSHPGATAAANLIEMKMQRERWESITLMPVSNSSDFLGTQSFFYFSLQSIV